MPTVGQLILESIVPKDLHGGIGDMSSKKISALMSKLAAEHPEKYRDVSLALQKAAGRAAYESGGFSVGVSDLATPPEAEAVRGQIRSQVKAVLANPALSDEEKNKGVVSVVQKYVQSGALSDAAYKSQLAKGNPLALQAHSGAKGKPGNVGSILGGDLLYDDANYNPVPFPVLRSYAEGLKPWEYFAGTFGARVGVTELKLGTAAAGYAAKRLSNASHRLVVTDKEEKEPHTHARGLPVHVDDPDNEGALLAAPAGPYGRNTILTPRVLSELRKAGLEKLLVRSPMVGGPADGGVYSHDVGVRERGFLSPVGDMVGLTASQAIAEPLSQTIISSKHCLSEGTAVRMGDDTIRPVEDIQVGDVVLGADSTGRTFPVEVTHTFDNGRQECQTYSFRPNSAPRAEQNRVEITCTRNHKILTRQSRMKRGVWTTSVAQREIGKISYAETAVVQLGRGDTTPSVEPNALVMGLLLGDGCYTESVSRVHLSSGDKAAVAEYGPYFADMGLKLYKCGNPYYYKVSLVADKIRQDPVTGRTLPGARNTAKMMLEKYGIYGKYAHEKVIPDSVWTWSTEDIRHLIGGLWATDGSFFLACNRKYLVASYASVSRKMADQVRDLLFWRLGVSSVITEHAAKRKRPLYQVKVLRGESVLRLTEQIPLFGAKKERVLSLREGISTRKRLTPLGYLLESTSEAGVRRTFDIRVDHPDHLFVLANGLIVSNSGGVSGASKGQQGFPILDRLISIPENFTGGAAHARADGAVKHVVPAPQGGHFVHVGDEVHYASPSRQLLVKPGDEVEAGDALTDGIRNPAEMVQHKGIGEGRRLFVEEFMNHAKAAGFRPHRRNLELIARGLIDHVELDKEVGEHVPGDVVSYTQLEHNYEPRRGAQDLRPRAAVGQYLERPALHYSIGTRVTPSVARSLSEHGVDSVHAHPTAPPFHPVMIRSQDTMAYDPDWMTRFLGPGLEKSVLKAVHRGQTSDPTGTSYVPAVAAGVGLGSPGDKVVGWDSSKAMG